MAKKNEELIKGYIAKANEKLGVAEMLYQEGACDDAVSRAYYAAFHAASAVLLSEGLSAETHAGLINLFGLHFVKSGKKFKSDGSFSSFDK